MNVLINNAGIGKSRVSEEISDQETSLAQKLFIGPDEIQLI